MEKDLCFSGPGGVRRKMVVPEQLEAPLYHFARFGFNLRLTSLGQARKIRKPAGLSHPLGCDTPETTKAFQHASYGYILEGLVEHLEKSSPLIIDEVRRWRDLLWGDYLDYKYQQKRRTDIDNP